MRTDTRTKRLTAELKKQGEIGRAATLSPVKNTEGLSPHEIVALITVMENQFVQGEAITSKPIQRDMNREGFTNIAISLV